MVGQGGSILRELKKEAKYIVERSIETVQPESSVKNALEKLRLKGPIFLLAVGKAAWRMTKAAMDKLGEEVSAGIVITKYGYSQGDIERVEIFEAGHPILDRKTVEATDYALKRIEELKPEKILFLISGGGSALFEKPLEGVMLEDLVDVNNRLFRSGASIVEINTVRKHLSSVKGGRFAKLVSPSQVYTLVLSDVLGDRLDSIASGPAYPDSSTSDQALAVLEKYAIDVDSRIIEALMVETPDRLFNVQTEIIGSVARVCESAATFAREIGYNATILTTSLDCEARDAGVFLASIAREEAHNRPVEKPAALIIGGETVVHVRGRGLGGRCQELALAFSLGIGEMGGVTLACVGTDGTDGPTDAAGAIVDGRTVRKMLDAGIDPQLFLLDNDSYHALEKSGDLFITGPTGTNVNDLIVLLCE